MTKRRTRFQVARPIGALCLHCLYKPARPYKNHPHLATHFCSDRCRAAHHTQALDHERRVDAEIIRAMLKMPTGRGPQFGVAEIRELRRRIADLLPDRMGFTVCEACQAPLPYNGKGGPRRFCRGGCR